MSGLRRARKSSRLSPAQNLLQAVPLSLFPSSEPKPDVAIPRETDGLRKEAIPRESGADAWAIPGEGATATRWASPRKSANPATPGTGAGKLKLSESGSRAQKSWTIRRSRESREALRVRRSDAGFAVTLRFRDRSDELREPYLCYLTASEWGEARQGSISQIVRLVSEKMRRRKDAPELAELINRLEAQR
jgi:hypothetical protein